MLSAPGHSRDTQRPRQRPRLEGAGYVELEAEGAVDSASPVQQRDDHRRRRLLGGSRWFLADLLGQLDGLAALAATANHFWHLVHPLRISAAGRVVANQRASTDCPAFGLVLDVLSERGSKDLQLCLDLVAVAIGIMMAAKLSL